MKNHFIKVEEAMEELQQGRMVIMVDDEDRENEGDLVVAAEKITPEIVNFMIKNGRGLLCLSLHEKDVARLQLPLMAKTNLSKFDTAFTVSIEAAAGVTTGISAYERAHTIQVAINPLSMPEDIITPGHVFPLQAKAGGVLERPGHTEGSIDLAKLAGLSHNAVICEILNDDGSMARVPDLIKFGKKHQLKIVSIRDLIAYRLKNERIIKEIACAKIPIDPYGEFKIKIFDNLFDNLQHIALIHGDLDFDKVILVRIHSECLTGDAFGSSRCDCGWQLESSIKSISEQNGIILYLRQEGRGIGLANKIMAYALQDQGMDTVEANQKLGFKADHRDYSIGAKILTYLGVKKVNLLTNNPGKIDAVTASGIEVIRIPLEMSPTEKNLSYLQTKRDKLGHLLNLK